MAKYLVTGGAGFIGSHIVDELVKQGHEVVVIDNLFDGKKENLSSVMDKIKFVVGDIRNKELINDLCKDVDFILHQAARRSVPASLKEPFEYNDVNINGTLSVLEAARKNDVERVVFASSSSVYGDVNKFPQKETFIPNPLSPYALTKLAGEHYMSIYWKLYGLKTISLRYFNVFGPRQDPNSQYAVVIPLFIKALMNNQSPIIFGNGKQSRDFTYVSNVVEGNILACKVKNKKAFGDVFNIANGESIRVIDLFKKISKLLGKNIKPVFKEYRKGDVFKTQADNTKAKKILGYKGRVSFDEGLKMTVEWFKRNF